MIKFRRTYLSACKEKLAKDESGLSTTLYLDTLMLCGKISQREADEYFKRAEYDVWIEPGLRKEEEYKRLHKRAPRREAA